MKENAKETDPKKADALETSSALNHSHMPDRARKSLKAAERRKADGNGRARRVTGENAADCPSAASGVPQPFHRSRQGAEASAQALRMAFAHGRNCVATSFKYGLYRRTSGCVSHGGINRA